VTLGLRSSSMWKYLIFCVFLGTAIAAQEASNAPGGILRALDKTSGDTLDIEMRVGEARTIGSLRIVMKECRYPAGNPSGNAYVSIEISEPGKDGVLFSGWMIASSPALSALEHRRYDVWVIRCITS